MFVSGVVVADDVNVKLGGDLVVDLAQKGEPLLMAMTRGGVSKDLAREIVEGGKQGHRSVTVIIVGLGADYDLGSRADRADCARGPDTGTSHRNRAGGHDQAN